MRIDYRIFEEGTLSVTKTGYKVILDNEIEADRCPHIHVGKGSNRSLASVAIQDCAVLAGSIPRELRRKLERWMEVYRWELLDNWNRMVRGEPQYQLDWDIEWPE